MAKTTSAAPARTTSDGYVEKQRVGAASRGQVLPDYKKPTDRTQMFFLAAHASSWDLVKTSEGWRLVPTLKRLIFQAGVNGTKPPARQGGPLDTASLEARARSKYGFIALTEVDDYLYETPGSSGPGHFLLWEDVKVYPDGVWEMSFDQDGYDLWRWSLVTDGKVGAPRDSIVAQMRTRLKRKKDRATRTPHLAQAQEAMKDAELHLTGLEEAIKAIPGSTSAPRQPARSAERRSAGEAT